MTLHYLSLAALKDLDGGRVYEAFDQAMRRVVADCEDRPGERDPYAVRCAVEIDALQGAFTLTPRHWDLLAAQENHQATIAKRIGERLSVPTFYGTPQGPNRQPTTVNCLKGCTP
jgi:hypothetical protein